MLVIGHVAEAVERGTYQAQVVLEIGAPLALASVAVEVEHLVADGAEVVVAVPELRLGELVLAFERVQLPFQLSDLLSKLFAVVGPRRGVVGVDFVEDDLVEDVSGVDESGGAVFSHRLVHLVLDDLHLRLVIVRLLELLDGELLHPVARVLLELEDHVVAAVARPDVVLEAQQGGRHLLPVDCLEVRPLAVVHQRLLERRGQA